MINNIALSIDIEDWYHTALITGSSFSKFKDLNDFFLNWKDRYDFITEATLNTLEILNKYKLNATFFLVADIIDKYPVIIDALKDSGCEIACHSLAHNCAINNTTKEPIKPIQEWENDLILAKEKIESVFDTKVYGYRAPGAYFADWMVPILENHDFKYDSSLVFNSVYNKTNVPINSIKRHPYWLSRNNLSDDKPSSKILEIPWSTYKFANWYLPGGGAYFLRLLGAGYFKKILKQNLLTGDTMLYFHSFDIAEEDFPLSNFRHRPFFWINKGANMKKKLEILFEEFGDHFTSCINIYNKHNVANNQ